jgi:hypothetical protein
MCQSLLSRHRRLSATTAVDDQIVDVGAKQAVKDQCTGGRSDAAAHANQSRQFTRLSLASANSQPADRQALIDKLLRIKSSQVTSEKKFSFKGESRNSWFRGFSDESQESRRKLTCSKI